MDDVVLKNELESGQYVKNTIFLRTSNGINAKEVRA